MREVIHVNVGKGYDIIIGEGLLAQCGDILRDILPACRIAVISDSNVAPLYLDTAANSLESAGFDTCRFVFPAGERSKNIHTLSDILEFLAENQLSRGDCVAALGGGVVGDMAGFAAACYMRGIRFVQLPTTLLAAVDSSVGGKTAIDLSAGKNLAGAFHQPSAVICDVNCLATLSSEIFSDGSAEAVKTALLSGGELYELYRDGKARDNIAKVISFCVRCKGSIVEQDEKESGLRKLLNLGHTVGHSIELCSDYSIPHGHAVAAGMAVISRSAARRGICTHELARETDRILIENGLPIFTDYTPAQLYEAALLDKKRSTASISVVLPYGVGDCRVEEMPLGELESLIADGCAAL